MKKKLLIVTTVPDTFEYILSSQPEFLNQYFQVTVVSSEPERLAKFARAEGVAFASVEMARGIAPLQDLKSIWNMLALMRRFQPDVVHSYTPKAGMVCAIAGFIAKVPVRVHTFTGLIFPTCSGFKRHLLKAIDRIVCRLNTNIVPEGRGVLMDLKPICNKPLAVIGSGNIAGIDLSYFDWQNQLVQQAAAELIQRYQLQDKKVFCFVGRLNVDKGLKELCQAFAALDQTKTALLIVGGLDDEKPIDAETLQCIKQLPGIVWLGFQADVRPALSAADVFVLPSYREGFPNVLLQAGAMAKPSVVTNVSGSNEIVQQDVNGWIVPVKDVQALQTQMAGISQINNAELRQKGQNALQFVTERFERRSYQQHLLQFYQDILS